MSKPKPTPAKKAALEMIRAEVRSVEAQLAELQPVWEKVNELNESLRDSVNRIKAQRNALRVQAKSIQP